MEKLIAKYQALTEREQIMVIAAGVAIIVGFLYFGMWSPLSGAFADRTSRSSSSTSFTARERSEDTVETRSTALARPMFFLRFSRAKRRFSAGERLLLSVAFVAVSCSRERCRYRRCSKILF